MLGLQASTTVSGFPWSFWSFICWYMFVGYNDSSHCERWCTYMTHLNHLLITLSPSRHLLDSSYSPGPFQSFQVCRPRLSSILSCFVRAFSCGISCRFPSHQKLGHSCEPTALHCCSVAQVQILTQKANSLRLVGLWPSSSAMLTNGGSHLLSLWQDPEGVQV